MKTRMVAIGIIGLLVMSSIMGFVSSANAGNVEITNKEVRTATTAPLEKEIADNSVPVPKEPRYTTHAPIYINGNAGFNATNGVSAGDGSASNPYIIENWDINASSAHGIDIQNTNVYFIIRNGVVHDGKSNYKYGIHFSDAQNGKIDNVTSYNNYYRGIYLGSFSNNNQITNCNVYNNDCGIDLSYSSNNQITNCTVYNNPLGISLFSNCLPFSSNNNITNCVVYNNSYGIELCYSSNNDITNCTVYNNDYGIYLYSSPNNIFRDNILNNNTYNFGVSRGDISDYYQDIDTSNTINGKPIYYIIEQSGLIFDETMSIGYLGLISCTNIKVEYLTLTNNIQGLLLANTSYSTVTNCAVYNNDYGISLSSSSNNNITNCYVYNNSHGISLSYSSNNTTITNCSVYNNSYYGISLSSSSNNNITNCYVYNNSHGISLSYSSNNNIANCNVYNNHEGIELYYSSNNNITNCAVYNNEYSIYLWDSSNNNITNCDVYNNSGAGIGLASSSNNNITNCNVYNNSYSDYYGGIWLGSSSNNNITNCAVYNNSGKYGIWLYSSSNNQITNCSVYNNDYDGIYLHYSSNNNITNCAVYNNFWYGIYLDYSSNNKLRNNILENDKYNFGVWGSYISYYYLDIDTSNTINGKPIYYIVEQNNLLFDSTTSVGYLGLVSCTNTRVENLTFASNGQGLLLANTSYSTITNCYVYNNSYGIYLYYSSNNEIHYCNIYNNTIYGVYNYNTESQYQVFNATHNWWGSASGPYHSGTNPGGTGNQVNNNVIYNPWLTEPWSGEINQPPIAVTLYSPTSITSSSMILTWTENTDTDFANYTIYQSTASGVPGNAIKVITTNTTTSWTVTGLSPSTTYYFTVRVYDTVGLYNDSNQVYGTTLMNHAPVVNNITANPTSVTTGGTVAITVNASDEDVGDTLTYHYECTGGTISGTCSSVTWTAPSTAGNYTITVYVNDGTVNSNSKSVTITVISAVENHAPVVNSITANPTTVSTGKTVTITVVAADVDGDILTYHYDYTGGSISGTGSSVTWTAPNTAGDYIITVYVNDSKVNSNSKSVSVTVTSPEKEKPKGFIPGFETIIIIAAISSVALALRRRKR